MIGCEASCNSSTCGSMPTACSGSGPVRKEIFGLQVDADQRVRGGRNIGKEIADHD